MGDYNARLLQRLRQRQERVERDRVKVERYSAEDGGWVLKSNLGQELQLKPLSNGAISLGQMATRKHGGFKVAPHAPQPSPRLELIEDRPNGGGWYALIAHREANNIYDSSGGTGSTYLLTPNEKYSLHLIGWTESNGYSGITLFNRYNISQGSPCLTGPPTVCTQGRGAHNGGHWAPRLTPLGQDGDSIAVSFANQKVFGYVLDGSNQANDLEFEIIISELKGLQPRQLSTRILSSSTGAGTYYAPPFRLGWRTVSASSIYDGWPNKTVPAAVGGQWTFSPGTTLNQGALTGTMQIQKTQGSASISYQPASPTMLEHEALDWAIANLIPPFTTTNTTFQDGGRTLLTQSGAYTGSLGVVDLIHTNPKKLKLTPL